jgi:hypothetical protein
LFRQLLVGHLRRICINKNQLLRRKRHGCWTTALRQKFGSRSTRQCANTKTPICQPTYKMPPRRRALQKVSGNARDVRNLTQDERTQIIAKSEAGCTTGELADEFCVTSKCIRNTLRRWRLYQTTSNLPRSSRPTKTTPRDVHALY